MSLSNLKEKLIYFIIFSIFLANFSVSNIGGRGFLIPELAIALLIGINFIAKDNVKFILFFIILNMILSLLNVVNLTNNEFLKSYVLCIIYFSFVYITRSTKNKDKALYYYTIGIKILVIFGILQFMVRLFGINFIESFVNNPFGGNTIGGNLELSYLGIFTRTNSLYYEPSIFGLVTLSSVAVLWYLKDIDSSYYKKSNIILSYIGVIISFSATALIGLAFLIILRIFLLKKINLKKIGFILIGFITSVIIFINTQNRISEIFKLGTSGYYRVIAPMKLIVSIIKDGYLFGIGIGQVENYIKLKDPIYMYKMGEFSWNLGLTIDNVLYMIIITFGFLSIVILYIFLNFIIINLNKRNIYIFIAFIFLLIGTGGYNFIYFNTILAVLLLIFDNERTKNEKIKYSDSNI